MTPGDKRRADLLARNEQRRRSLGDRPPSRPPDQLEAIRALIGEFDGYSNSPGDSSPVGNLRDAARDLLAEVENLRAGTSRETLTVICARCFHPLVVEPHIQRVVNSPVYCSREECIALDKPPVLIVDPNYYKRMHDKVTK